MATKPRKPSNATEFVRCTNCEKSMLVFKCRLALGRGKFCSRPCSSIFNKIVSAGWNKGITGKKSHSFGNKHSLGLKRSDEYRRKISNIQKSKRNHLWVHGNGRTRTHYSDVEYKIWRDAVFSRDDYTCQLCGQHGGYLEADHIKPWALYEELRYVVGNGRTLCRPCHVSLDTHGWGTRLKLKERVLSA